MPYSGSEAEVWAIGVILYIMLYKRNPFQSMDDIKRGKLEFPKTATRSMCTFFFNMELFNTLGERNLLKSILRVKPSDRPSAKELLKHAWLSGRT